MPQQAKPLAGTRLVAALGEHLADCALARAESRMGCRREIARHHHTVQIRPKAPERQKHPAPAPDPVMSSAIDGGGAATAPTAVPALMMPMAVERLAREPFGDRARRRRKSAAFAHAEQQPADGQHRHADCAAVARARERPEDHDPSKAARACRARRSGARRRRTSGHRPPGTRPASARTEWFEIGISRWIAAMATGSVCRSR